MIDKHSTARLKVVAAALIFVASILFSSIGLGDKALAFAPDTVITSTPSDPNNAAVALFEFSSSQSNSTFECSIDSGGFSTCSSPFTSPFLSDGAHTFSVRAINSSSEADPSPANFGWTNTLSFPSGDGSPGDPYQISGCDYLLSIPYDLAAHYVLTSEIDCSNYTFTPIGTSGSEFTGELDGNNYRVVYLDIDGTNSVGLFGETNGANIHDITLSFGNIVGTSNVGALVGIAGNSTISNVGSYDTDVTATGTNVGGLIGQLGGGSLSKARIMKGSLVSDNGSVGGLVGYGVGPFSISDSFSQGTIEGARSSGSGVGGLVGSIGAGPSVISRTYANMTFSSLSDRNGGLVGIFHANGTITNSFSVSDMTVGTATNLGGLFGEGNGTSTNNYFDQDTAGVTGCSGTGSTTCIGISQYGYFNDDTSNPPLNNWTFHPTGDWHLNYDGPPTLTPINDPVIQCDVGQFFTPYDFATQCEYLDPGWGTTHWQAEYKIHSSSTWLSLPIDDDRHGSVTLSGISPYETYDIRMRFTNDYGTGSWIVIPVSAPDTDSDGTPDTVEDFGYNSGDTNDDSTRDYLQANVNSVVNTINDDFTNISASGCASVNNVQFNPESTSQPDLNYSYPNGILNFRATSCGSPGVSVPVIIRFYGTFNENTYILRKFDSSNGTYLTVQGATFTRGTLDGHDYLQASYLVADGGELDADGVVDGNITDPIGPAVLSSTIGAPNTGLEQTNMSKSYLAITTGLLIPTYGTIRRRYSSKR